MRALVLALLLGGCVKDITGEVEHLAERACACTDAACGTQVLGDLRALIAGARNVRGDERRAAEAARRLGDCLLEAGIPAAEIDAAVNPAPPATTPPSGTGHTPS